MRKDIHTYENSQNKRWIQELIYSQLSGINCNALILAGPTCKEYLELVSKYIAKGENKIVSYEKDQSVYFEQLQLQYNTKKLQKKVKFYPGEVINAQPQRFIDLDFCCTLKTAEPTLAKLFNKQRLLEEKGCKIFIFTLSYMRDTNVFKRLIAFLQLLLGQEIVHISTIKMEYGTQYYLHMTDCYYPYVLKIYSYQDTSPMYIVQIIY